MARTGCAYQPGTVAATGYVRSPKVADRLLRRILPAGVAGLRHGGYLALNRFHVDGPAYGGLGGDVLDAGRFLRLHLGDGHIDGHRVLAPKTTRAMRQLDQRGWPFDDGIGISVGPPPAAATGSSTSAPGPDSGTSCAPIPTAGAASWP